MRIGPLRHRVALQSLTVGSPQQTAPGEPDAAWTTTATVWASIEPLAGRELFAAQEHHADVDVRIRIRYRSGMTEKMRVSYDGKLYSIRAVIDRSLRNWDLELLCQEGVDDG